MINARVFCTNVFFQVTFWLWTNFCTKNSCVKMLMKLTPGPHPLTFTPARVPGEVWISPEINVITFKLKFIIVNALKTWFHFAFCKLTSLFFSNLYLILIICGPKNCENPSIIKTKSQFYPKLSKKMWIFCMKVCSKPKRNLKKGVRTKNARI